MSLSQEYGALSHLVHVVHVVHLVHLVHLVHQTPFESFIIAKPPPGTGKAERA